MRTGAEQLWRSLINEYGNDQYLHVKVKQKNLYMMKEQKCDRKKIILNNHKTKMRMGELLVNVNGSVFSHNTLHCIV